MGPRSADRGNHLRMPWQLLLLSASMGPRSADRGNIFGSLRFAVGEVQASMGPRSADGGNGHGLAGSVDRSPPLQWGRDQLIAEMKSQGISRAVLARFNGAAIS